MRALWLVLSRFLPLIAAARKSGAGASLSPAVLQLLLTRGLGRTPMGMIGMILLRKALSGEGRVFGMDLASRRKARMGWLAALLRRETLFSSKNAKSTPPVRRRLSR